MKKKLLLLVLLFPAVLSAQQTTTIQTFSQGPSQYILGKGDVLTITVNLWGYVNKPGIYTIPSNYDLISLISSAGGPTSAARLNDIRIIRRDEAVIMVDIEKFIKTGNKDLIPPLQPGDTIIVSGSIRNLFLDIVSFARDLAIIVNVFLLASRIK
jgi:protein involved in polysaccharide export with SLBB domain